MSRYKSPKMYRENTNAWEERIVGADRLEKMAVCESNVAQISKQSIYKQVKSLLIFSNFIISLFTRI